MDDREKREETSLSISTSPVAPLLQSRVLDVPAYPGLLASLDRFEILDVLGSGGMGVVLLARDPTRPAPVAIKIVRPELVSEPRAVHRFLVEARHMQRLSHPHVLPVLEVSDRTEGPYFVVPYMAGGSLSKVIQPGNPLPSDRVLEIATHMAEALAFAHTRGLTHRDLKPGNVLLDNLGNAYLSDFGLVRTVYNDSLLDVRRHQTEGTPAYMPPEIARGEAGDTRADIYSLGALMYEMLTGEAPYEGPSPQQILEQVKNTAPPSILSRNPAAHRGLAKIAETAMARGLPDRYASMQQMLEDLQRIATGTAAAGVRRRLLSPPRSRWFWGTIGLISVALVVSLFLLILRKPSFEFQTMAPTEKYWSKGDDLIKYDPNDKASGTCDVRFSDRECTIRISAQSDQGNAARKFGWIDQLADLKSCGDTKAQVVIKKADPDGRISVQICNGANPGSDKHQAVDLFHVDDATRNGLTLTIWVYPSLSGALVSKTGLVADASFVDLSPIHDAAEWHLRLRCDVSASGDEKNIDSSAEILGVSLQATPPDSHAVVFGRVTQGESGAGIEGVEVWSTDSPGQRKTNADGFYWLPLPAGQHGIVFEHLNYQTPATQPVNLRESDRRQLDKTLANGALTLGQVVEAIHVDQIASGGGFLPWKQGILGVAVAKPGDCRMAYAPRVSKGQVAPWQLLAKLHAEGNRENDRPTVDSKGMAFIDGRIYSVETWTARLMVLDPEKGVIESRIIPDLEWPYGIGVEGTGFWTLDLNGRKGISRLLFIDLKTLAIREAIKCPPDVRGLTFGDGRLWVCSGVNGGRVFKLDPATLRATKTWKTSGDFPGNYKSVVFKDGELWGYSEQTRRFCSIYIK